MERHSGMVHGVAMRVAGDALADEVTQAVFIILARKAGTLRDGAVVGAGLYRTARFVALEAVRAEKRRRLA
jgi:DNA-directed RNA polymerase specialized sigma24 family protein